MNVKVHHQQTTFNKCGPSVNLCQAPPATMARGAPCRHWRDTRARAQVTTSGVLPSTICSCSPTDAHPNHHASGLTPVPKERVLLAYRLKNEVNFLTQNIGNAEGWRPCSRGHRSRLGLKRPPSRLLFVSELHDRSNSRSPKNLHVKMTFFFAAVRRRNFWRDDVK